MNLEQKQAALNALMTEIESLGADSEQYGVKLTEAKELKEEIETMQANLVSFNELKEQAEAMPKAQSIQAGKTQQITVGKPGFTQDPKKGFQNVGEMLSVIASNTQGKSLNLLGDVRLEHLADIQMTSGQSNTTSDGLMIPAELLPEINTLGKDASDNWLSRFTINRTNRNAVEIRRDAATTRGGSVGLVVGRANELQQLTSTRQVFEKTTVKVDKIFVYTEVSEEDLSDFALLQSNIMQTAPELLDIKKGEEVLFGTGAGEALGFKNGGDTATVTRNTAGKVKAEDVVNMRARFLRTRGTAGAFWLVNQAVWSQLPLMTIGDQPVFVNDLNGSSDGFLLGMPVFTTEDCEALGSVGDVYLVNPDAYFALEKEGGDRFATSMHVKFDFDLMAFRWTSRFGGAPKFNSPYIPRDKNSTTKATLSNFVILGTA